MIYLGATLLLLGLVALAIEVVPTHPESSTSIGSNETKEPFSIVTVLPSLNTSIARNTQLRVVFSESVAPSAATSLHIVSLGQNGEETSVPGTVFVENNPGLAPGRTIGSLVYQPLSSCGATAKADSCFAPGDYKLELDGPKIKALNSADTLVCSGTSPCAVPFTVGSSILSKSTLALTVKPAVLGIMSSAELPVTLSGTDQAFVMVTLDRGQVGEKFLGAAVLDANNQSLPINTSQLAGNTSHFVSLDTSDAAGHRLGTTGTISVYAQHCVDGVRDQDELDVDCGGNDCLACQAKKL